MSVPATAQTLTILHSFGDGSIIKDGENPQAALVRGSDGNFYGTTSGGTSGAGTVFKMTPSGVVTILHNFGDGSVANDGSEPMAALVEGRDGNFYGTTYYGGSAGWGTVFKMTPAGAVTILHSFQDGSIANDGENPQAALVEGSDENFYGTTVSGGMSFGAVFKVTSAGAVTILYCFGDGGILDDGGNPNGLVEGSDGIFYGTTQIGGSTAITGDGDGFGTIFQVTPEGSEAVLHSFADGTVTNDGIYPKGALIEGEDGNFYGTTLGGGSAGVGAAFQVTSLGAVTILHSFQDGSITNDGSYPRGLVEGNDGNFYGMTLNGGSTTVSGESGGSGTVFKITPSGAITILHSFDDGSVPNDGYNPYATLVQGSDGNFYGTTNGGGSAGAGTVFKLSLGAAVAPPTVTLTLGIVTATSASLSATATSGDGTPLTYTWSASPTETPGFAASTTGTATSGTAFTNTLRVNQTGTYTVTVTVTDAHHQTASASKMVTFTGGSTPIWNARDVAAAPDGTARLLWTRSDGAAGVWIMSASNTQTSVGPTYGPYPGWSAKAVSVAGDGTSRVLWTNTNGMAGVWTFNATGTETGVGPTYGPYAGWTATDIATSSNGTSRVLWTNTNGMAGVWTFNAAGTETIIGTTYGPYLGWSAKAVGAASDGTARVLWTNTNGEAGVWSFNAADAETIIGKTYGPYPGWSAKDIGTSSDGTSNVLWTNTSGAAGVWTFNAADIETTIGTTYGPYSGYAAAALDAANDQSRVLWVNTSHVAGLWSFNAIDAETLIGPTYGPF